MKVNHYLSILLILTTIIMLYIAYLAWRRRKYPVAYKLFFVMMGSSLYTIGYAHEIILPNLEQAKICIKIEYLGISFISTFWLLLVIQYVGYAKYLKRYIIFLLFTTPVLTLIFNYTNEVHHLIYKDMFIDYNFIFPIISLVKGPWYWVFISYTYLTMAVSLILLIFMFQRTDFSVRKQIMLLAIGSCIPWILDIIYSFGDIGNHLDLSPLGFAMSSIMCSVVIFKYNLLLFTPIAIENVFESISEGVIVLDTKDHIINFNKTAGNIIPALNNVTPDNSDASNFVGNLPGLLHVMYDKELKEYEISIRKRDAFHYYKVTKTFISNRKQVIIGKILVLVDITEITMNYDRMTNTSAQLAAVNTLKDRLITIIINDIAGPVDTLMKLTSLLEERKSNSSDIVNITKAIREQVGNTFSTVEKISECCILKELSSIFLPIQCNLSSLVNKAINLVRLDAENKNIGITTTISKKLVILAEKEMIEFVMKNLLTNAIKYSNRNGDITITAVEDKGIVVTSIKDTGIGITDDKVQLLFQNVNNVSTAGTEGEKGAGLGLFICRQIIQRNGGDIWVESTPGIGSNFFISIPAIEHNKR